MGNPNIAQAGQNTQFSATNPPPGTGRPKGSKNLSTIIQKMVNDENFVEKVLKKKPDWWNSLPTKNGIHAITVAMMVKAMSGDAAASNWIAKHGFGERLLVGSDPENPLPSGTLMPVEDVVAMSQKFAQFVMKETKPKAKPKKKPANEKPPKS